MPDWDISDVRIADVSLKLLHAKMNSDIMSNHIKKPTSLRSALIFLLIASTYTCYAHFVVCQVFPWLVLQNI